MIWWLFLTFFSPISAQSCCEHRQRYRLSGIVKPSFYSIKIQPNIEQDSFLGEVVIHFEVKSAVKYIEFHSRNLNFTRFMFDGKRIDEYCTCKLGHTYEFVHHELVRIRRDNCGQISPGAHIIHIKYNGLVSKNTQGLFKGTTTKNGVVTGHLLATDFEPSNARSVFPCFDEPSFKAKFEVNLVVPDDSFMAVSNMEAKQISQISSGILYKFEVTPPMSTYLISFVISQHMQYTEFVDETEAKRIRFRLYKPSRNEDNTTVLRQKKEAETHILEFASQVLHFFANYTQFEDPLRKIDFVGFDRNESSATENWGLVTFNTSLLSSASDVYDISQKLSVVAHEMSHFWFGNLVTNDWWDDIWLHESLATFMSLKAEDHVLRNNASKYFARQYLDSLFWLDAKRKATPVINFAEDPQMIEENFNDMTYIKGATILRMIVMIIGEDNFKNVLRRYISECAYKTVTTAKFLEILVDLNDEVHLHEFLETYLYQSHFPVISVEETEEYYEIRQQSSFHRTNLPESMFDFSWTVPITYTTSLNSTPTLVWLQKDVALLNLQKGNSTWIKLNNQQMGYYVVDYSSELWSKLINHFQEIQLDEKFYLLDEVTNLIEFKHGSCRNVFLYLWELSNSTTLEESYLESVYITYTKLKDMVKFDKEAILLLRRFFSCIYRRLGDEPKASWFYKNNSYCGFTFEEENNQKPNTCLDFIKRNFQIDPISVTQVSSISTK